MFRDRHDAGQRLAGELAGKQYRAPVVLALPRGGVPVAAEIARRLGAPLDILMVRKLGAPSQPELAMGAVARTAETTETVLNDDVIRLLGIDDAEVARVKENELAVIAAREARYLQGRQRPGVMGRTAVVVDDGVATGATTRAALHAARASGPRWLVLAVPVAPPETLAGLREDADEVVCLEQPGDLGAIGFFYEDFTQVSDEEVVRTLDELGLPSRA